MTIPVPVAKAITQALSCSHPTLRGPDLRKIRLHNPELQSPAWDAGPSADGVTPSESAQHPLRVLIPEAGRTVQASLRDTRSIGLPTSRGCTPSPPLCRRRPVPDPPIWRGGDISAAARWGAQNRSIWNAAICRGRPVADECALGLA